MDISIVIPSYNEDESLPHLAEWIDRVMKEHGFSYEVIIVDDGSRDGTWKAAEKLHAENPCYHGILDLLPLRAMWLSLWMPTCRTVPMRFPNCTT